MTESDDDNKITPLFPSSSKEEPSELLTSEPDPFEDLEEQSEQKESDEEQEDENNNVVRVHFGGSPTTSSSDPSAQEGSPGTPRSVHPQNHAKLKLFSELLEKGMVMVTLDTRVEGVLVPPQFQDLPELRLNFSHLFHLDDFVYDTAGLRASLSFQGQRHFCDIPWEAVFLLYSHETGEGFLLDPSRL